MDEATSRRPNVPLVVESIVRDVYFGWRLLWKNVTVPLMSVLVAPALSALIPALRATHVDPMTTLRND